MQGQDIAGDWQGLLNAGTVQLHIVLHITKDSDGTLSATMDSVDQHAYGLAASSVSLKNSKLKFDVDKIQGSYVGKLSADGTKISGSWSQGGAFLDLDFKRATNAEKVQPKPGPPSDIDGTWLGTVEANGMKLRVAFHIVNTADGLTGTIDSLDTGQSGIPMTAITRNSSALKVEVKQADIVYDGKISPDLGTIDGIWKQHGNNLPLILERVKNSSELERRRPQNPVKPYPYREEEVSYDNKQAPGVVLAGTLTIPQGKGPFPSVLLVPGSGPHDRDETLFGHKPFLVLADYLTRKGILVLRVDDRGVGKSTGTLASATTADLATDAESWCRVSQDTARGRRS